jgi:flagellin
MGLQISTNAGAVSANYYLGKNSKDLEKSMARLASGLRISRPSDDAGGLAVSMKLKAAINRLKGAELNIQNGISFLEVQDGILESIGNIVDRMSELKGLSRDVMKNANDQETYNREFKDLQLQLKDIIAGTFNGVSLFARYSADNNGNVTTTEAKFAIDGSRATLDHTIDVYTSADGSAGAKVSIHKALAWSALTFNSANLTSTDGTHQLEYGDAYDSTDTDSVASRISAGTLDEVDESTELVFTLAAQDLNSTINLDNVSVNVFLTALENIAALRAQNGSTMSRLEFQEVNLSRQRSNMEAAVGRITDVDMGAETTRMAKYNVLRQASAAMLAQANQAPEVVMMLIR